MAAKEEWLEELKGILLRGGNKMGSDKYEQCYCLSLPTHCRAAARCNACVNNIVHDKNVLVNENYALRKALDKSAVPTNNGNGESWLEL